MSPASGEEEKWRVVERSWPTGQVFYHAERVIDNVLYSSAGYVDRAIAQAFADYCNSLQQDNERLREKAELADEVLEPLDAGRASDDQQAFCIWCDATADFGQSLRHESSCPVARYAALTPTPEAKQG